MFVATREKAWLTSARKAYPYRTLGAMDMRCIKSSRLIGPVVALATLAWTTSAFGQDPKFAYKDKKKVIGKVNGIEWKGAAQAGALLTTGNSNTTTLSAGAMVSRKTKDNKFLVQAKGALARSDLFIDSNGDGLLSQMEFENPDTQVSTQSYLLEGRYDRFLTPKNALYVQASVFADEPAGKNVVGGGQVGYSRSLYSDKKQEVKVEIGYDFSYENQVGPEPGVSIHSVRVFAGYTGKVTKDTSVGVNTEALFNVNELDAPTGTVKPFRDARVNSQLELKTKLLENISFSFRLSSKYDNAPAFRAPLPIAFESGFRPLADKLDVLTEASLIVNFL